MVNQSTLQPKSQQTALNYVDVNLNLFGIKLFGQVDENKERENKYQEAVKAYPVSEKMGCDQVEATLNTITKAISAKEEEKASAMASGGSGRPQDREIWGLNKRKVEIQAVYENLRCEILKKEAEEKKFNELQISQLQKVKQISDSAGNATKYIIWGTLGVVVLISTIIIIRKTRK